MITNLARRAAVAAALSAASLGVWADGVSVRFDLSHPALAPFPSDRYTVRDWTHNTFRRVQIPKPDCTVQPSHCADIDVINTLDGFSTQPRITVPFTGDIDPTSVSSETVFLVNLGDTLTFRGFGDKVGINQVVWDPATRTLAFESDELLAEHSRWLLVVTDGVRDANGQPIESSLGAHFGFAFERETGEYRRDLRDGLRMHALGRHKIVAASLFTTQSITADLHKIMRQIKRSQPSPVDFMIGTSSGASLRTVFALGDLDAIVLMRQVKTQPPADFVSAPLPLPALGVVPGAVAQVAYAKFRSPDYQTAQKYIPTTGTLSGQPQPQGENEIWMQLFVPAGAKPAGGWPVAIFGHGFTDSMYGTPFTVASVFASRGIATLSINVVGHGGGALSNLNVLRKSAAPVVITAGGRGIDQDGNGTIDSTEGVNAAPPRSAIGSRDGLRQTVIDLMQLVRQIEVGVDIDADGHADLNADRIYYAGQSFGGIYGTILLGVEPNIKAGVPNVPGGSIAELARLSPAFRGLTGLALATRQPPLLNLPPTPTLPVPFNFNENIPLRDQPPLVNTVPGAMTIAQLLDAFEWVQQSGNPVSYAAHIAKRPLPGNAAKPVLFQFAKGDATVPNPTTSAILRAGDFADRTAYFRNDLAFALNPANVPKNPHTFLTRINVPAVAPYAVGAQQQIAVFFASGGSMVIDPDGPGPIFEVPITPPLPESLNFIP